MASERHVVVDARLANASGIGTYIRNVVPHVARLAPTWRFTVIVDGRGSAGEWAPLPNVGCVSARSPIYTVREQLEIASLIPRDANLYWATHYNFPLLQRKPLVVTIHDVGHLRLPEHTRSVMKLGYARFMFALARRRAAGLLFDSEFTRSEFTTLVGNANGGSEVVHLGVGSSWFEDVTDESPVPQPYFLYVGNIKPHKNLHTLISAFEKVREEMAAHLILIGRSENFRTADLSIQRRISTNDDVSVLGELSEQSVQQYVRHATALVLPSLYEGFGLPPLEAMAAGCPAIVSRSGSLPEVCGDAAVYFDAADVDALARAMRTVASDASERARLVERGRAQARKFDWATTARKTHRVLARAMNA